MSRFRGPGRRGLRDEMQATWNVYDATRPIRKEDLAAPPPPEDAPQPPAGGTSNRALEPEGGAVCFACGIPDGVHQRAPTPRQRLRFSLDAQVDICDECLVRMNAAEPPLVLTDATDAEIAKTFGVTEMDVRESRRWAREQAERSTLVEGDPAVKH